MQSSLGQPLSTAQLEQRAQHYLAAGRFRKARDDFKLLCKQDRARYLSGLIQANVGLTREMLAKGMTSEAQQVIAYLKTIATPADLMALEIEQAARSNDWNALVPRSLATLADPHFSLSEPERRRLADQVIVAFEPLPADGPASALAAEARAVQEALQAVCEQAWPRVAELLRPVSHESVFRHWKQFIKGLVAFHQGEQERARQCFDAVPPDSTPGRASAAYRLMLDRKTANGCPPASPAAIEAVCRLAGLPALGRPLARAEQLWRERQPARSYQTLRADVPSFPSEELNLLGALSEFYFHSLFVSSERIALDLARQFDDLGYQRRFKSAVEAKLAWRALALFYAPMSDGHQLRADWNLFLNEHEKLHGHNPRLASLALGWLGEQLMATRPRMVGFGRAPMRDEKGALESLTRSVEVDPTNLSAHLNLSELYRRLRLHSDRNRLLDRMTERFPENKDVLIQAARSCLDRNACKRGLQYLERVRERDLLDPVIPGLMIAGLLQQARQQFQQKRPEPARATLERARSLWIERADDLERSRWSVLTRQGLLEQQLGEPQRAEALFAEARAASPCPEAFLFFAHMHLQVTTRRKQGEPTPFSQELARLGGAAARTVPGALLLRIFRHAIGDESPYEYHAEAQLIRKYLRAAVRQSFTREEARGLVEQAEHIELFAEEAAQFVRAMLKQDPKDPWFRLMQLVLNEERHLGKQDASQDTLQSIIEEAGRRGDHATVQRAERMIANSKRGPISPPPRDDTEFDDEPWPDDVDPLFDNDPVMQEAVKRIAAMSDAEFEQFKKSEAKNLPPGMFELITQLIRGRKPLPPVTPSIKPPLPPPPKPDPNQMNLF